MSCEQMMKQIILTAILLVAGVARAGVFYVNQGNAKAADTNAGTEDAPFKTIQAAVDKLVSGDTVLIKAGVYRETVTFKTSGQYRDGLCQPVWPNEPVPERITLAASGNDAVIVDGSEAIAPALWKAVAGQTGVFEAAVDAPRISIVSWNGRRLPMCLKQIDGKTSPALPMAADANSWYFDDKAKMLSVNLGGADPSKDGVIEAAVRSFGLYLSRHHYITIRGLTVRRVSGTGIECGGSMNPIIEDCHVMDCDNGISAGLGDQQIVRRCFVHDIDGTGINAGRSRGAQIYDNTVHAFFQDWAKTGNIYKGAGYILFGAEFARFYNNISMQPDQHQNTSNRGDGFWPDCHSQGQFYVGNAAQRCAIGYYIESPAIGSVVLWNTASKNYGGIWLRQNSLNIVAENYCVDNGTGLILASTEQDIPDVAHNLFSHNWLKGNRLGLGVGAEPAGGRQTLNYAQRNVYDMPKDGIAANWGGQSYKTLKEFQQATGQEPNGVEAPIDSATLDLVQLRVDDTDTSHEQIPMFGNSSCQRTDSWRMDGCPYFWRYGDANGSDTYSYDWGNAAFYALPVEQFPYSKISGASNGRTTKPGAIVIWATQAAVPETPVGGFYLFAGAMPGRGFGPEGCGWWSPSLPVAGGATLDLALWMKIENVTPTVPDGGAVVYAEWSDWTGQNKSRSYLVGGENSAKPANPEFTAGSKNWAQVQGSVTAPENARRFAIFMGGRNCMGTVSFDEIRTISVRPGEQPKKLPTKSVAKYLVDTNTLSFSTISLATLVNRSLADEQADDGKGGWSDQGPDSDMKGLSTGSKTNEGVPFELLAPQTCIVLDSSQRPQSKLPKSVTIPIDLKANVLYFLHSGAWLNAGKTHWIYTVNYADGKKEEINVVAGVNVRDWSSANVTDFENTQTMRTTVWPELVGNKLSPACGIFQMEWLNPRPDVAIQNIEMTSSGNGVPILLAITAGQQK